VFCCGFSSRKYYPRSFLHCTVVFVTSVLATDSVYLSLALFTLGVEFIDSRLVLVASLYAASSDHLS
jgi:hypothetical protein